jgi:single-stranded-DNA-specific exonuclease
VASRGGRGPLPADLILTEDTSRGLLKGSGRSIPECDLHALLTETQDVLAGFGGHRQAAGLSILLKTAASGTNASRRPPGRPWGRWRRSPRSRWTANCLSEPWAPRWYGSLSLLEPFGCGNPEPVFASPPVTVVSRREFGDNHVVLSVRDVEAGVTLRAKAWRMADAIGPEWTGTLARIAYSPKITYFSGVPEIELRLRDCCQGQTER